MTATGLPYEPRPRDFRVRLRRGRGMLGRNPSLAASRRPGMAMKLAALLAAVAVPALAAPEDWHAFQMADPAADGGNITPMPFETAGQSFPGSAFYYLAPEAAPPLAPGIHSDAEPAPSTVDAIIGPAARPLRIDSIGTNRARALQCLATAIYYEAASEPDAGQRAVAQVVLNRVAHPAYPDTVCGVVYQGSERTTGCQFSFTCDGSLARAPVRLFWLRAEAVARAALAGYVHAPAGLATHYHTVAVHPVWADKLRYIGTIGAHRFYRFGGPAGQPGTFRFAYAGSEPLAAPHPRNPAAAAPALDPAVIQQAYETGLRAAAEGAAGHPGSDRPATPVYTEHVRQHGGDAAFRAGNLPQTMVRPEYANSGRWISEPGS